MQTITFECEVITPMFLAGADGTKPELRPPSIKGALRFWWRAMNGHLPLADLQKKETEIFGGTSGDSGQRSKVIIRVECDVFEKSYDEFNQIFFTYDGNSRRKFGKAFPTNAMYYMGYGVANWVKEENRTKFVKPYIPTGTSFKVIFRTSEENVNTIIKLFKVIEQFGALGSKSRNGFGCFRIKKAYIDNNLLPIEYIKYSEILKQISTRKYTSFSSKISVFETKRKNYSSWEEAFKELTIAYQYARENLEKWHNWNDRELIALPIVVKGEREIEDNFITRHSKPYFFHVSKTNLGFKGSVLFMPYEYLADCPDVKEEKFEDNKADYFEVLDDFNDLLKKKLEPIIENVLSNNL